MTQKYKFEVSGVSRTPSSGLITFEPARKLPQYAGACTGKFFQQALIPMPRCPRSD